MDYFDYDWNGITFCMCVTAEFAGLRESWTDCSIDEEIATNGSDYEIEVSSFTIDAQNEIRRAAHKRWLKVNEPEGEDPSQSEQDAQNLDDFHRGNG